MKQSFYYRSAVGIFTLAAGLLSAACVWVGAKAVAFDFDAFSNPLLALQHSASYQQLRTFMLLDLSGYYLLLLPVIFYFYQQYRRRYAWMPLLTFSGLSYVLIGAMGAAILSAVWPQLMQGYLSANGQQQQAITTVFSAITMQVTEGLWNTLEVLFAAIWWIGIGALLYKQHKIFGIITILTGISALLDSLGNVFKNELMAAIGLNAYLVLGVIWPFVTAFYILRRAMPHPSVTSLHQNMSISKSLSV